jgi:AhpD family alkylhydroperoxidase
MTPAPFRWALRGGLARVAHVRPVPPRAATGLVADVYAATEREFGLLAPPVALHSPDPQLLAVAWTLLRETLLVPGLLPRPAREAVAAGVSLGNACPYCVEVHSAVLGGLHDRADARALGAGDLDGIADPDLRVLAAWGRDGGPPPVPSEQRAELLAVAFVFQYVNAMVHVFLGPSALPAGLPAAAGGVAVTALGAGLAPMARRDLVPGAGPVPAEPPGPSAALPGDVGWAAPHPVLSTTLARACAVVEAAAARVLAPAEKAAVRAAADRPAGPAPAGLGPVARLAWLTACAPYRVTEADVAAFRAGPAPSDSDLIAVTAWASLTAARARTAERAAALTARTR